VQKEIPMEAVRILTNGKVKTGHRTVRADKSLLEAVLFVAKGRGGPWRVEFDKPEGSPFAGGSTINIAQGSFASSGPLDPSAVVKKSYRYTVYDGSGNPMDDPDVEIE
jgi:hypothetical protein